MAKAWRFHPQRPDVRDVLARALGVSPVLAQLLANRGIVDPTEARAFLRPSLDTLADPFLLPDMDRAVERVQRAIKDKEPIVVHGDYDVDGLTGTALLLNFFRIAGVEAGFHIPHRVTDGYSLSLGTIEKLRAKGTKVLITVDCGTSDTEEISFAQRNGIDVVVTDHHEPPATLPRPCALVNPKLPGSCYPHPNICGSAVAFKLAWALAQGLSNGKRVSERFREFLMDSLGYVALGTVADVVPLVGESRAIVAYGLESLRHSKAPGVRALLAKARVDQGPLTATHVAFRIAPRLNAGGRVGDASLGVELLTCTDPARAEEIVETLEVANRERQRIEAEIVEDARAVIDARGYHRDPVIVVGREGWHGGVVGIVASKLVEAYHRPAIVLSLNDGKTRGSARSCGGFHLFEALQHCADLFESFGGHAQAAGVTMSASKVDDLRARINAYATVVAPGADYSEGVMVDSELPLSSIGRPLVDELAMLAPHGAGNPAPVFASTQLRMAGPPRLMGKKGEHMNINVLQGGVSLRAVGFGMGDRVPDLMQAREGCDAAYSLELNDWQGRQSIELHLKDIRPSGGA